MWIQACAPGFSQTFKRFVPVFKFTKEGVYKKYIWKKPHTTNTYDDDDDNNNKLD